MTQTRRASRRSSRATSRSPETDDEEEKAPPPEEDTVAAAAATGGSAPEEGEKELKRDPTPKRRGGSRKSARWTASCKRAKGSDTEDTSERPTKKRRRRKTDRDKPVSDQLAGKKKSTESCQSEYGTNSLSERPDDSEGSEDTGEAQKKPAAKRSKDSSPKGDDTDEDSGNAAGDESETTNRRFLSGRRKFKAVHETAAVASDQESRRSEDTDTTDKALRKRFARQIKRSKAPASKAECPEAGTGSGTEKSNKCTKELPAKHPEESEESDTGLDEQRPTRKSRRRRKPRKVYDNTSDQDEKGGVSKQPAKRGPKQRRRSSKSGNEESCASGNDSGMTDAKESAEEEEVRVPRPAEAGEIDLGNIITEKRRKGRRPASYGMANMIRSGGLGRAKKGSAATKQEGNEKEGRGDKVGESATKARGRPKKSKKKKITKQYGEGNMARAAEGDNRTKYQHRVDARGDKDFSKRKTKPSSGMGKKKGRTGTKSNEEDTEEFGDGLEAEDLALECTEELELGSDPEREEEDDSQSGDQSSSEDESDVGNTECTVHEEVTTKEGVKSEDNADDERSPDSKNTSAENKASSSMTGPAGKSRFAKKNPTEEKLEVLSTLGDREAHILSKASPATEASPSGASVGKTDSAQPEVGTLMDKPGNTRGPGTSHGRHKAAGAGKASNLPANSPKFCGNDALTKARDEDDKSRGKESVVTTVKDVTESSASGEKKGSSRVSSNVDPEVTKKPTGDIAPRSVTESTSGLTLGAKRECRAGVRESKQCGTRGEKGDSEDWPLDTEPAKKDSKDLIDTQMALNDPDNSGGSYDKSGTESGTTGDVENRSSRKSNSSGTDSSRPIAGLFSHQGSEKARVTAVEEADIQRREERNHPIVKKEQGSKQAEKDRSSREEGKTDSANTVSWISMNDPGGSLARSTESSRPGTGPKTTMVATAKIDLRWSTIEDAWIAWTDKSTLMSKKETARATPAAADSTVVQSALNQPQVGKDEKPSEGDSPVSKVVPEVIKTSGVPKKPADQEESVRAKGSAEHPGKLGGPGHKNTSPLIMGTADNIKGNGRSTVGSPDTDKGTGVVACRGVLLSENEKRDASAPSTELDEPCKAGVTSERKGKMPASQEHILDVATEFADKLVSDRTGSRYTPLRAEAIPRTTVPPSARLIEKVDDVAKATGSNQIFGGARKAETKHTGMNQPEPPGADKIQQGTASAIAINRMAAVDDDETRRDESSLSAPKGWRDKDQNIWVSEDRVDSSSDAFKTGTAGKTRQANSREKGPVAGMDGKNPPVDDSNASAMLSKSFIGPKGTKEMIQPGESQNSDPPLQSEASIACVAGQQEVLGCATGKNDRAALDSVTAQEVSWTTRNSGGDGRTASDKDNGASEETADSPESKHNEPTRNAQDTCVTGAAPENLGIPSASTARGEERQDEMKRKTFEQEKTECLDSLPIDRGPGNMATVGVTGERRQPEPEANTNTDSLDEPSPSETSFAARMTSFVASMLIPKSPAAEKELPNSSVLQVPATAVSGDDTESTKPRYEDEKNAEVSIGITEPVDENARVFATGDSKSETVGVGSKPSHHAVSDTGEARDRGRDKPEPTADQTEDEEATNVKNTSLQVSTGLPSTTPCTESGTTAQSPTRDDSLRVAQKESEEMSVELAVVSRDKTTDLGVAGYTASSETKLSASASGKITFKSSPDLKKINSERSVSTRTGTKDTKRHCEIMNTASDLPSDVMRCGEAARAVKRSDEKAIFAPRSDETKPAITESTCVSERNVSGDAVGESVETINKRSAAISERGVSGLSETDSKLCHARIQPPDGQKAVGSIFENNEREVPGNTTDARSVRPGSFRYETEAPAVSVDETRMPRGVTEETKPIAKGNESGASCIALVAKTAAKADHTNVIESTPVKEDPSVSDAPIAGAYLKLQASSEHAARTGHMAPTQPVNSDAFKTCAAAEQKAARKASSDPTISTKQTGDKKGVHGLAAPTIKSTPSDATKDDKASSDNVVTKASVGTMNNSTYPSSGRVEDRGRTPKKEMPASGVSQGPRTSAEDTETKSFTSTAWTKIEKQIGVELSTTDALVPRSVSTKSDGNMPEVSGQSSAKSTSSFVTNVQEKRVKGRPSAAPDEAAAVLGKRSEMTEVKPDKKVGADPLSGSETRELVVAPGGSKFRIAPDKGEDESRPARAEPLIVAERKECIGQNPDKASLIAKPSYNVWETVGAIPPTTTAVTTGDTRKRPVADANESRENKRAKANHQSPLRFPVRLEEMARTTSYQSSRQKIVMKSRILEEARIVHDLQGAERLFAEYWSHLTNHFRLNGNRNATSSFFKTFLKTKKLKRLHNRLILGKFPTLFSNQPCGT